MSGPDADAVAELLAGDAPAAARALVSTLARETPVLASGTLTERCGGRVLLKAENLQRTGSFKLRGALNRVAGLEPGSGVVAGSAGNHAQALAYAASARGVACEVFMPEQAPVAKVAAVQAYGGSVTLGGESVDDCVAAARARAAETGAVFVHPFDDPQVILGQATLGLELLDQVADLADDRRAARRRWADLGDRRRRQADAAGRARRGRPGVGLRAPTRPRWRPGRPSRSTRSRRSPTASP